MPPAQAAGLAQLLEALFQAGVVGIDQPAGEQLIAGVAASGPEAAAGIGGLIALTLYLNYGLPDATGQNPNWATFGYPGPLSLPPDTASRSSRSCRPRTAPCSRPTSASSAPAPAAA